MDKKENYNGKRSYKLFAGAQKNLRLSKQIKEYIKSSDSLTETQEEFLWKLDRNISECASYTLYRYNNDNKVSTFIGSHTCGHKTCNICNQIRQKDTRRKYYSFFENPDNEKLIKIKNTKTETVKYCTLNSYKRKFENSEKWIKVGERQYDLMHLTLTVPHYKNGFKGDKYYFKTFISLYNKMRKSEKKIKIPESEKYYKFSDLVYGGEYGIETTINENGLNIHAHSLIFVRKIKNSRNILHLVIMVIWNNLTINADSSRELFKDLAPIKKGNSLFSDIWIVENLHPKGTTLIGLETIFSISDNGEKIRSKNFGDENMKKAVLETVKYHFEPQGFEKNTQKFNLDLISELLPVIYRQKLYHKFGCLEFEKSLNIRDTGEELKETYEEMIFDEETGEIFTDNSIHFILHPLKVWHKKDNDNEIVLTKNARDSGTKIETDSTRKALDVMNGLYGHFKKFGKHQKPQENE